MLQLCFHNDQVPLWPCTNINIWSWSGQICDHRSGVWARLDNAEWIYKVLPVSWLSVVALWHWGVINTELFRLGLWSFDRSLAVIIIITFFFIIWKSPKREIIITEKNPYNFNRASHRRCSVPNKDCVLHIFIVPYVKLLERHDKRIPFYTVYFCKKHWQEFYAISTQAPPTALIFSSALLLKNLALTITGCLGSLPLPRIL